MIQLDPVSKEYNGIAAADNLTTDIATGEIFRIDSKRISMK